MVLSGGLLLSDLSLSRGEVWRTSPRGSPGVDNELVKMKSDFTIRA